MTLDGSAVCHSTLDRTKPAERLGVVHATVRAVSRHCGEQHAAGSVRSVSRCARSSHAPLQDLSTIVEEMTVRAVRKYVHAARR
jgi:hypothetical protein